MPVTSLPAWQTSWEAMTLQGEPKMFARRIRTKCSVFRHADAESHGARAVFSFIFSRFSAVSPRA